MEDLRAAANGLEAALAEAKLAEAQLQARGGRDAEAGEGGDAPRAGASP
jgi:hypothetical protein